MSVFGASCDPHEGNVHSSLNNTSTVKSTVLRRLCLEIKEIRGVFDEKMVLSIRGQEKSHGYSSSTPRSAPEVPSTAGVR